MPESQDAAMLRKRFCLTGDFPLFMTSFIRNSIRWSPRVVEIVAIALLAWSAAAWLPTSKNGEPSADHAVGNLPGLPDMQQLASIHLFGESGQQKPASERLPQAAVSSRLKIELLGTVVAGQKSAAIVALDKNGEQKVFRIGDVLQSGVVLKSVAADAITVDHNGRLERIAISKDAAGAANAGWNANPAPVAPQIRPTFPTVPGGQANLFGGPGGSLRHGLATDLPTLLSQARAVPHMTAGRADGFTITEIAPGSLYDKAGLQNGDVVRKVNGQEITSPQMAIQMYQRLQGASRINLEIVRSGTVQELNYSVR